MFEYDESVVRALLNDSDEFKYLYNKHHDLKDKVRKAETGVLPLDDVALGAMKKEKLLAKDKMASMIDDYRREHATA
jgi:uncharacterized protein YdcH (DUF465 family)